MATLADIAEAANVSKATVSYVLNDTKRKHVNEVTRQRVLAVAKELNYLKDDIAHAVSTGKTKVIAYFHSSIQPDNWYGISSAAEERDFLIKAFMVRNCEPSQLKRYRDICLRQRIAGAIFHHAAKHVGALQQMLVDEHIPVATTAWGRGICDIRVVPDDRLGGELAAGHLLEMGYRHVVLCGPSGTATELRFAGFIDCFSKYGIDIPAENILIHSHHETYKNCMFEMLREPHTRPWAIFCASSAAPLFAVLNKLKLSVPEDLAIVGYGDDENARFYFDLTSICEKNFETGRRCCELLIDKIEGKLTGKIDEKYPVELIIRNSSRPGTDKTNKE